MKTAILVDSSSGISLKECQDLNIYSLPMVISVDGKDYLENINIDREVMYNLIKEGKVCKTSQPSIGTYLETIKNLLKEYDEIIYFPISSGLSGTYQNFKMIAEQDYKDKVFVVDTYAVSGVTRCIVMDTLELIKQGFSAKQIMEKVEDNKESIKAMIIPENVDTLKRGGRISPAAAAIAGILKIVPILKLENGKIDIHDKVRTLKKAYSMAITDLLAEVDDINDYYFLILYAGSKDLAEEMAEQLNKQNSDIKFIYDELASVITAHTGNNTCVIAKMKKLV